MDEKVSYVSPLYGAKFSKLGKIEWVPLDLNERDRTLLNDEFLHPVHKATQETHESSQINNLPKIPKIYGSFEKLENIDDVVSPSTPLFPSPKWATKDSATGPSLISTTIKMKKGFQEEVRTTLLPVVPLIETHDGWLINEPKIVEKSTKDLTLRRKYGLAVDDSGISEFDHIARNIFYLSEDLTNSTKDILTLRMNGAAAEPLTFKYNTGASYYDENNAEEKNASGFESNPKSAEYASTEDSEPLPSQHSNTPRCRKSSLRISEIVLLEPLSVSTLKRREHLISIKRKMQKKIAPGRKQIMLEPENSVQNAKEECSETITDGAKVEAKKSDDKPLVVSLESSQKNLLVKKRKFKAVKSSKQIVAEALEAKKSSLLQRELENLPAEVHRKMELKKMYYKLLHKNPKLRLNCLSDLMRTVDTAKYLESKEFCQEIMEISKYRQLKLDKRMVKHAMIATGGLLDNAIKSTVIDSEDVVEEETNHLCWNKEYPEPLSSSDVGIAIPMGPEKWCGNPKISIDPIKRRNVGGNFEEVKVDSAGITKAMQEASQGKKKAAEALAQESGMFSFNILSTIQRRRTGNRSQPRPSGAEEPIESEDSEPEVATEFDGAQSITSQSPGRPGSLGSTQPFSGEEIRFLVENQQEVRVVRQVSRGTSRRSLNRHWKELRTLVSLLSFSNYDQEVLKSQRNQRAEFLTSLLKSDIVNVRISAAKALSFLRKRRKYIVNGLEHCLEQDPDPIVQYECCQTLMTLGAWTKIALEGAMKYLASSNSVIKLELLEKAADAARTSSIVRDGTMDQFIRKLLQLSSFDQNEKVKFQGSVLLARIAIYDNFVIERVFSTVKHHLKNHLKSNDADIKCVALSVLVKEMNIRDEECFEAALTQVKEAGKVSYRKSGAVCIMLLEDIATQSPDRLFDVLVKCLWDEPNSEVKVAVVETISKLGMAPRVFEYVFKQLQHREPKVRSRAVLCLVTMEVKNETVMTALLDIIELDSSSLVRIHAINALGQLNFRDSRVYDALKDRCQVKNNAGDLAVAEQAKIVMGKLFESEK